MDDQSGVLVEQFEKFTFSRHEAAEHRDLDWELGLSAARGVGGEYPSLRGKIVTIAADAV
ncbi:MAG: hypothetical protein AAB133_05965 [Pseudomonadota bacterium]